MAPCYSCNGKNAVCKRCVCACSGRPCISRLPLKEKKCANILCATTKKVGQRGGDTSVVCVNLNQSPPLPAAQDTTVVDSQVQVPISSSFRYDESVSNKSDISVCDVFTSERDVCFDELMCKAYGTTLVQSVNSQQESEWYLWWKQLV